MKVVRSSRGIAAFAVLALVLACLTTAPPAAVASVGAEANPVRATTTTPVPCAFWNQQLPTDWYLPPAAPIGLLYAQHGFGETKDDWSDFATSAAAAGFVVFAPTLPTANLFGCTVQSLGDNTRFLTHIAALFTDASKETSALAKSFATALALAGRTDLTLPNKLAIIGHSIGAESALYVASRLVADDQAGAELHGIVLADPVRSLAGGNLAAAVQELAGHLVPTAAVPTAAEPPAPEQAAPEQAAPEEAVPEEAVPEEAAPEPAAGAAESSPAEPTVPQNAPLPVLVVAAPAQACNGQQSGTRAIISGLPERTFFGAAISTGSHADIFGGSVNKDERLTCGLPRQVNIDATRTLALGWLTDAVTGTTTADLYPGGASYDTLLSKGVISTLR